MKAILNTPALIERVVAAYRADGSYNSVACGLGIGAGRVRGIMLQHAPGLIRDRHAHKTRPKRPDVPPELTLAQLGQHPAGRCKACGIPMVVGSKLVAGRAGAKTCGLCVDYARRRAA